MKRFCILCLLVSTIGFGQQGINYKAIIQDGDQVVANTAISLYFTVIENATTDVYKETHVVTTTDSGIVVTNIGEGLVTLGSFETIDWTKEQYLNVSVNIGNGLVDLGTTAFKQVPYALHAKTAETFTGTIPNAGNLVKVIENGNEGYRLIDSAASNHGDIGENAIDLSNQSNASDVAGATGEGAFAAGDNTRAVGYVSIAMGQITEAADYGVAMGYGSKTLDSYGIAIGYNNNAVGRYSTALGGSTYAAADFTTTLGWNTRAESRNETTFGSYNTIYTPEIKNGWNENDRLFVIGNGSNASNRSDALIVKKGGDTEVNGTLTIDALNDNDGYTLPITKGTAGQVLTMNLGNSGTHWSSPGNLVKVEDEINGQYGYRLFQPNYDAYGTIGANAIDLSTQPSFNNGGALGEGAFALGADTKASGRRSTAMGENTDASGITSMALGYFSVASGNVSFAFGDNAQALDSYDIAIGKDNTASGANSVALGGSGNIASGRHAYAMGLGNTASGINSYAFGIGNIANDLHQMSIGKFCTDEIGISRRLFVVGNGNSPTLRKDAFVVLENGNASLNGDLNVEEVNATDSGDADMKAYIYGRVSLSGNNSVASSDGFTIERTGIGVYRINFNNPPPSHTSYIAVASLSEVGFVTTERTQQYLLVNTYNMSGNADDKNFSFVVYKK